MQAFVHHLAALGWGWVALFAMLDVVALAAAARAVAYRGSKYAFRCFLVSLGASFLSVGVAAAAVVLGLTSAFAAEDMPDATNKAREVAGGISVAMNGAAFGMGCTFVAALATVVSLVASVAFKPPVSKGA